MVMGDYGTNVLDLKQGGDVISVEDLAWADSCLAKDPELSDALSDDSWNSFGDALLEILSTSQSDRVNSIIARRDSSPKEKNGIEESSNEDPVTSQNMEKMHDGNVPLLTRAAENNIDDNLTDEETDTLWSRFSVEGVFLPTYKENLRKFENSASELNLDIPIPSFPKDASLTEDIFKVWDLDIVAEEDELTKQLNKALADSSLEYVPSIDNLISGIAGLSFDEKNG